MAWRHRVVTGWFAINSPADQYHKYDN